MSNLVERLRRLQRIMKKAQSKHIVLQVWDSDIITIIEAADAMTAKDKEIEALRGQIFELKHGIEDQMEDADYHKQKRLDAEARAETAERRVAELEGQLNDFLAPTLKSFRLEDGRFDMSLAGDVVQRVALVLTTLFRESGAMNYVEMRINAKDEPFESYVFNVQKVGDEGKTPHELRQTAERERDMLGEVIEDTARELGCENDNEAILIAIDRLRRERDEARAALTRRDGAEKAVKVAKESGSDVHPRVAAIKSRAARAVIKQGE